MSAPTLLVGLGGVGSEIVQKVFDIATPKQRENIAFVIFDTDVNELKLIEEKTPQIHTIQTSARMTVGEYLKSDTYSRDKWFPVNRILNSKALTEGAGQVRAISRLALNTAIQQGKMGPLNEAIEELYKLKGQKTTQAPRVIITGSLCGGTGSGLILPISMYIRNFMSTKLQQSSSIIRGFFLLPDVFDGVIKSQSERNNLRSNAYAAVREIDTFMMKGDGSLPAKYDVHFMAPRAGSNEPDEYKGLPMDFCFLFDAQNIDGMKLNSFAEYKEHAANCIYSMAIAPTSKRSNSSEDNVIREIVFAGGRNRFAGAGSSMLVYPTEDIKKYLALKWTKESVSNEWLEIDHRFADEQKTNKDMMRKGYPVSELDRGEHYINVVNEGFTEQKYFPSAIRNLCFDIKGYIEKGNNWVEYADALDRYIDERIESQRESEDIKEILNDLKIYSAAGNEKTAGEDIFTKWYENLLGYKRATIKCTNALARNIAYSLFKETKDYTHTKDSFRIEYWLQHNHNDEEFIHPNAVRYFLYNALNELKAREAEERENVRKIESFWADFDRKTFDIAETKDHIETEAEYYAASHLGEENAIKRFIHRSDIEEVQGNLTKRFGSLFAKTGEYWKAHVYAETYKAAMQYIKSTCEAFQGFYDVLDRNISKIDKAIGELEEKYSYRPGEAMRYVCADKKCMRGLSKDVVNLETSLDIPSEMTGGIYQRMKLYALAEQKPEAEKYFTETFENTIVSYLKSVIDGRYSSAVNMDIITALEKEALYENPEGMYELEDQRLYAKHIIESTEILAKPFIESPIGKEARIIPACAYSPKLAEADFPGRKAFVASNLKDSGGVEDESIDKNIILFYQSVYDLRANELSKFAPPKDEKTYDRPGGEYYKAYYELIKGINPEPEKSRAITPHIDRWWHIISKMPDLDEESQARQEEEINIAFLWGMLAQYIHYVKENEYKMIYKADRKTLNLKDDDEDASLIVSNGTPCDHLYEVLDAFTIYPGLVEEVNKKITLRIERDLYNKVPIGSSILPELLNRFCIDEYTLPNTEKDGVSRVRSIFELPLLMKRSVPTGEYHEDGVIKLLNTIFSEFRKYICRFCSKKEFPSVYTGLIDWQFKIFIENIKQEGDYSDAIYDDSLFVYICKAVAEEFDNYYLRDKSAYVWQVLMDLKKVITL